MTNKIDIYNIEGKVTSQSELPASIFDVEVNPDLIALAVRVLNANHRQGTSKVKTRGEVALTTHKIWKQKGTGRARHGSKGAPIFVGGGVAHGPTGEQSYSLKLPKKMRTLALKGVLGEAFKAGNVMIVDGLDKVGSTTKDLTKVLANLKVDKKTVLMLENPLNNILRAGKNIDTLTITQAKRINVIEIMNANKIIIHKPAIDTLVSTFSPKDVVVPVKKVTKKKGQNNES
jgi:large subunit ribosomal protein L4